VLHGSLGVERSSSALRAAQRWQRASAVARKRRIGARRPLGRVRGQGSLAACAGDVAAAAASAGTESNGTGHCNDGKSSGEKSTRGRGIFGGENPDRWGRAEATVTDRWAETAPDLHGRDAQRESMGGAGS
jgi:hypothetical protein